MTFGVVIVGVLGQQVPQVSLTKGKEVVQALVLDRLDPSLSMAAEVSNDGRLTLNIKAKDGTAVVIHEIAIRALE